MSEHRIFEDIRTGREESFYYIDTEALCARSLEGETPVLTAVYHGRKELAAKLLSQTPKPSVFCFAACGTVEQVSAAMAAGAGATGLSADGFTPLALAAAFNSADVVRLLLDAGAPPNQRCLSLGGVAPIHAAVFGRKPANVRLLLERGADANLRQEGGFTPLHGAMEHGHQETIVALLAYGADVNARTNEGKTPADMARVRQTGTLATQREA